MENEFNQALNKKFMNPAKFAVEIEKLVLQEKILILLIRKLLKNGLGINPILM